MHAIRGELAQAARARASHTDPKVPDATTYDEPGYMTAVAALVIGLLVSIIGFACVWLARLWRRGRIVKADRVAAGRHSSGRRA